MTRKSDPKDHMANERTFLAWIRTCLGLMAFGFVVEKFSFFVRKLGEIVGQPGMPEPQLQSYSSVFGITLVAIGAILNIFAFLKFKKTEKQINKDTYQPSIFLDAFLAFTMFFGGIFLIVYLIYSRL